jgi:hypothetical protein
VQLRLQVVWHEPWHWLVADKVFHRRVPQRLAVIACVDALLIVESGVANETGLGST